MNTNKPFYQLASSSWEQEEIQAIQRVIQNGMYSMNTEVSICEQNFIEFTKVNIVLW